MSRVGASEAGPELTNPSWIQKGGMVVANEAGEAASVASNLAAVADSLEPKEKPSPLKAHKTQFYIHLKHTRIFSIKI